MATPSSWTAVATLVFLALAPEPSGAQAPAPPGRLASPGVTVSIRSSDGQYECADAGVARVELTLDLDVVNATASPLAVPASDYDGGSQRYWKASDPGDAVPRVTIDGIFKVYAVIEGAGPPPRPRRDDFVLLPPGSRHAVTIIHGVMVEPSGAPHNGILVPGSYRATLDIEPGFRLAQQPEALRQLEQALGPLWLSATWSEPFEFRIRAFPDRLPSCATK